ncbi:acyl-CoA dehydrogenase family protein [Jiella sp. MQZ9-1]|uniref:Acyl-CoA dehydrogenase family protein n=1 Tax=Jiella flava TaxID=2816857 RepID=A0A939JX85_9HYPH|nr:acyl-CoA dehydrogenase family protein [Jiella flava]MBO0663802.1 acyl-CoA dehydrogenase family protein [Jiella flava]MCD2472375.1 acyl-CoA dehydrogenase family protein [Jiella flava]
MDFALSDEQEQIFAMARGFATEKMAPFAAVWEADKSLPREVLEEVAQLGMAAIYVRDDYGSGLSRLDAALIFEALSYGDPTVSAFLSIHNMVAWMVDSFGTDAQRAEWLPKLATMQAVGSYCLTEPGSGSDASALRTSARREGDDYVLDGTKSFISGAGFSDLYLVMARTGEAGARGISAILVENGRPGLSFGAPETKMGWTAQPTAEVHFDACRVPATNLLGEAGKGFFYAMMGLDGGRLNIAACALGAAQAALDKAVNYMRERKAFGRALTEFQALQFRLADMETELQAARVFLRQAAWKLDCKAPDATKFCAMAKRFVTDTSFEVANMALQLHGGYGYLADYGIEKIVRDLRVHQILEGTNEIMRMITARALLGEK